MLHGLACVCADAVSKLWRCIIKIAMQPCIGDSILQSRKHAPALFRCLRALSSHTHAPNQRGWGTGRLNKQEQQTGQAKRRRYGAMPSRLVVFT